MKKILALLLFISLIVPAYLQAAPASGNIADYEEYYSQTGIQPSDVQALELGQTTFGTIMDVAQLSKLGFKGTKVEIKFN